MATKQTQGRLETRMGLPVLLRDDTPEGSDDLIHDPKGLEAAIAVARILIPAKLRSHEIRFLRHAIGLKGVDLARFLDVSPEHLSRWEKGAAAISTNAERVLRLRVLNDLKDLARGVPERTVNKVMNIHFEPVSSNIGPLTLIFDRVMALPEEDSQPRPTWFFRGIKTEERKLRAVAG